MILFIFSSLSILHFGRAGASNNNNNISSSCSLNSDCNRPTVCLNGICTFLIPPNGFCVKSSDCVSYSYYKEDACSKPCSIESECSLSSFEKNYGSISINGPTKMCCKAVPAGAACNVSEPAEFSGCAGVSFCAKSEEAGQSQGYICSKGSSNSWIIGVILSLLGSTTLNLGNNIQKYAFRKNFELPPDLRKKSVCSMPAWILGQVVFISGNVINMVAFSFAAQSLLAPLGAFSLVTNAVFAPLINKEPFSKRDFYSILLIISGTTLVVIFADRQERKNTLCALFKYYSRTSVIIVLCVFSLMFLTTYLTIKIIEANKSDSNENSLKKIHKKKHASIVLVPTMASNVATQYTDPVSAEVNGNENGNASAIGSPQAFFRSETSFSMASLSGRQRFSLDAFFGKVFKIPGWAVDEGSFQVKWILPFAYATLGGIGGSFTSLFAKSVSEVFKLTFSGDNQFTNGLSYVLVILLIVASIIQLYWVNEGLKKYDALLQIPVFFTIWTVLSVVMGGVYFDEFSQFTEMQYIFFLLGILVIFCGAFVLSQRLNKVEAIQDEAAIQGSLPQIPVNTEIKTVMSDEIMNLAPSDQIRQPSKLE